MEIRFYTFYKRENSTARPSGEGHKYECTLKSDTSIVHPSIIIDYADQEDPEPHLFNYAYIPDFRRWYFVGDTKVLRGIIWEYSLQCDILATYKDTVSVSYLYLLRCSRDFDGSIVDSYYPVKTSYHEAVRQQATPWISASGEDIQVPLGCFILGIASKPGNNVESTFGSIKYIAVDRDNLCTLINYLMDADNLTDWSISIDGVTSEAAKSIIDPLQFIKSCQWCPLGYGSIDTTEHHGLNIWSWSVPSVDYKDMPAAPPYLRWNITFNDIPRHPLYLQRGNYLNTEPFTKLSLCIPPFGLMELDTTLSAGADRIIGLVTYDLITGMGILEVHYDNAEGTPACRIQSQIGVPIQLTQVYNDYVNAAGGVIGGTLGLLGSILTGNIGGAIMGGVGAVSSAANAMRPVQSSLGGNGGFSDLAGYARLYAVFYDPADEDRSHVGRPLCREVNMSTMSQGAYCLAMDGDIAINGTAGEQQQLKAYLEGGFFYE